jgi:hypothetical protein
VSAQPPRPRLRRALALGTATAFGLGGLFATPAFAETAPDVAPTSGAVYEENSLNILGKDGVAAVGTDGDGNVVIVVSEENATANNFADQHENVVIREIEGGLKALADTDVVGGAGYLAGGPSTGDQAGLCSVGFSAWDPEGNPAVVSAGHCTLDGAFEQALLTLPSGDTAGGGDPEGDDVDVTYPLGNIGFSQYGAVDNGTGAEGDPNSVDIAVIDDISPGLTLLPEVTDWTTSASEDLSLSTTEISSVGAVDISKPFQKSGRTTGLSTSNGIEAFVGWAKVGDRFVKGFGSGIATSNGGPGVLEGDSGGAVFQGEKAVGVVSGGSEPGDFIWAADLQSGLSRTGGYTIMLAVDAPVLDSPADGGEVQRGSRITGTGPANADIVVTTPSGEAITTVKSNRDGNWQFRAPTALGAFAFDVQAVIGFNTSSVNSYELEVVPAPLVAPVISSPVNGRTVETELTAVTGTGFPGATVTIAGDVETTATVDRDGNWSAPVDLSYGAYTITATQSFEGETSPVATAEFAVVPVAPTISTPADGSSYQAADAPESASGVGIEGALVTVSVNGEAVGSYEIEGELPAEDETPVDDADLMAAAALPGDNWEIALGDALVAGDNVISVTQALEGVTSAAASVTVEIIAAAGETPGNGNGSDDGDDLAVTGGPDLLPIGLAAWLFIAAGIATVVVVRKRRATVEG